MQEKSEKKILFHLKTKGDATTQTLAKALQITTMGARKHLLNLQNQLLVTSYEQSTGVGRPKLFWQLTEASEKHFPDTHATITVSLIESIQQSFGEQGLLKVIKQRDKVTLQQYQQELHTCQNFKSKLKKFVALRTDEGYMAEYQQINQKEYLFIENHCPICAAANACQQFCLSELQLFKTLFKDDNITIKRVEHILADNRRCVYQFTLD